MRFRACHADGVTESWLSIVRAKQQRRMLPPESFVHHVENVHFARYGHHRISVARALGEGHIDARITAWQVRPSVPWDTLQSCHLEIGENTPAHARVLDWLWRSGARCLNRTSAGIRALLGEAGLAPCCPLLPRASVTATSDNAPGSDWSKSYGYCRKMMGR